jgi:hypothetical protein
VPKNSVEEVEEGSEPTTFENWSILGAEMNSELTILYLFSDEKLVKPWSDYNKV